eukprot:2810469-Rhodomonas_salina.1
MLLRVCYAKPGTDTQPVVPPATDLVYGATYEVRYRRATCIPRMRCAVLREDVVCYQRTKFTRERLYGSKKMKGVDFDADFNVFIDFWSIYQNPRTP